MSDEQEPVKTVLDVAIADIEATIKYTKRKVLRDPDELGILTGLEKIHQFTLKVREDFGGGSRVLTMIPDDRRDIYRSIFLHPAHPDTQNDMRPVVRIYLQQLMNLHRVLD